jgi:hypothetical protein
VDLERPRWPYPIPGRITLITDIIIHGGVFVHCVVILPKQWIPVDVATLILGLLLGPMALVWDNRHH